MERALPEDVNIINAEMLLRERGIELNENRNNELGAFSSSITAEVSGGERSVKAAGTVFGHNMPRLVSLDDYRLEAYMDGKMLVFTHQDVPGIIGKVGTAFGEHEVNIAQMSVGRAEQKPGGSAVGVLNLDNEPTDEASAAMLAIEEVDKIQFIELPGADELPSWLQ